VPLKIELPPLRTPIGTSTRRYTTIDFGLVVQSYTHCACPLLSKSVISRRLSLGAAEAGPSVPEVELQVVQAAAKKITPKKKQLASKIKKAKDN
jgi:hypothetical protein